MNRSTKRVVLVAVLVAVVVVASGCELSLPAVDCSDIDQPDMGGLVCLGRSVATMYAGLAAILALLALLAGSVG
ncbi:MAG: hypothetical protein ACYC2O_10165 [Microthrixaceae bacterium]